MKQGLPAWLMRSYYLLYQEFGLLPFRLEEAKNVLGVSIASVIIFKLRERGWTDKFDKGRYRLIHPLISMMQSQSNWRRAVSDKLRLPLCEIAVARLLEELGKDIRSILLFGSFARNETTKESDIDILLVSSGLPESYSERVSYLNKIIYSKQLEDWQDFLWKEYKIFPLVDLIGLMPEELKVDQPFFLDIAEESVIVLDRSGFIKTRLENLRKMLSGSGARKVTVPDGGHYWILGQSS